MSTLALNEADLTSALEEYTEAVRAQGYENNPTEVFMAGYLYTLYETPVEAPEEVQRRLEQLLLFPYLAGHAKDPGDRAKVKTIRQSILEELRKALCQNNSKYREEVKTLATHSKTFIAALAGYVAAQVNLSVVMVSALIAGVLLFVCKVGVNAFCALCDGESPKAEKPKKKPKRP